MTATSGVSAVSGISGGVVVVDPFLLLLAQRRQRLEAGDAEQPGRDLRAAFEGRRLPPQFEEDFVRDIVSHHVRSRLARHEPVDPGVVAHEQEPDGGAISLGDPLHEFAVGLLGCGRGGHGGNHEAPAGSVARTAAKRFTGISHFSDFWLSRSGGRAEGWGRYPPDGCDTSALHRGSPFAHGRALALLAGLREGAG